MPALRFLPPSGYDPTTRMILVANLAALHVATAATTVFDHNDLCEVFAKRLVTSEFKSLQLPLFHQLAWENAL